MKKSTWIMMTLLLGIVLSFVSLISCDEDNFFEGEITLGFSTDTLRFDTVFTQLGSATRILKLYNPENRFVQISEIRLEDGANSKFRINVDGLTIPSGEAAKDIRIAGEDSLYIFVEVTINPDDPLSSSPFILEENLLVTTNGNTQSVLLEAWGQNANYLPSTNAGGSVSLLTCDLGTEVWDDPKPYVIYGILVVDSCDLVLPKGTNLYIHGGIVSSSDVIYNDGIIFFGANGKLISQGTLEEPVTIQGDRLEDAFSDVAGQWGGIRLGSSNLTHEVNYTIIKNSIVGVRVDSAATLNIKNTIIDNTSGTGLLGIHATINGENLLITNNGGNSIQLEYGGNYDFKYSTLANFGAEVSALRLSNALCLDALCGDCLGNDLNAAFTNCIITGSRIDEINLFDRNCNGEAFDFQLDHCLLRVNELLEDYPTFFSEHCFDCYNIQADDALFVDVFKDDYHLDTLSVAESRAIPILELLQDLDGVTRDNSTPDVGAYEYIE